MKAVYSHRVSIALLVSGVISMGVALAWFYIGQPLLNHLQQSTIYPAGIPWLQNEQECSASGRTWEDDTCWDAEHDPNF
ncbi:MAG: hypothetical protein IGS50_06230 [Synechococcales cyanobacterium C42_A2020_086]|nr:hypothetical protein [Synechococcales cyanobacterium C42_A2020_086]